jgi:hypothetical protein
MRPVDVSSLLSHLWRSLEPETKARYKEEETRLQREHRQIEKESLHSPPRSAPLPHHFPSIQFIQETGGIHAGHSLMLDPEIRPPPPVPPMQAQVITRRFDRGPAKHHYESAMGIDIAPPPISTFPPKHNSPILFPSWNSSRIKLT